VTPKLLAPGGDLAALAKIHAACFSDSWNATAIADLLTVPGTFACIVPEGFIVARVAGGEAEILTLAVLPAQRRKGAATALVRFTAGRAAELGAVQMFLEVAIGNTAARGLYGALGFAEVGRRKGYYALGQGKFEDALILRSILPLSGLGIPPASG